MLHCVSVSVIFQVSFGHCQHGLIVSEKNGLWLLPPPFGEIQNQRLIIGVSFCRRCLENKESATWTEFSFQLYLQLIISSLAEVGESSLGV
jgi:hypothetical protein